MDPLDPMDHWTYSLCHLTGLLPAWGRCQPMTSFELFTAQLIYRTTKCPLDICLSIGSNGQNQMSTGHTYVHWIQRTAEMSIGHMPVQWIHWIQWTIGHTILPLSSHRPATCMGTMSTYDVIRVSLFTAQPNVHWTYACPLDPMDKIKCPLDTSMSIGSNGQLKYPLDICLSNGSIGSNAPLDILPLPSHRPAYLHGVDVNL